MIELGAGTGVAGLACAVAGAGRVVLSDLAPNVPRLQRSIEANIESLSACRAEAVTLEWGNGLRGLDAGFDLVIAADCIFCHTLHTPLAQTCVLLAKASRPKQTRLLIAEEERWKDISGWWAECAAECGLRLVSETALPDVANVPRKMMLREYEYVPDADLD